MKRALDVAISAAFLVVLSPVMAAIAIAVYLSDPGPIIFRGRRIGRYGRPFAIFKYRSMRQRTVPGAAITVGRDPRVTSVGRVLRATKLDELPQLVNVLRGDMSLVGPRPEAPEYVEKYTPEQREVLNVRPGITGPSQVAFRHEEELLVGPDPEWYYLTTVMPAKLAIDREYARNASVWLDLRILARTAISLVRPLPPPLPPRLIDEEPTKPHPLITAGMRDA